MLHTDFEKVFDKIPHKQLISKMYSYDTKIEIIKWVEAFLTNGRQ